MAIRKLYQKEPSFKLKVKDAIELRACYGGNTTLDEVVSHIQGNKIHMCPKCYGTGQVLRRYNAYPKGLPDSGWVEDWKYENITCDLCKGDGYTEVEYQPRMVQDGWEAVE